jgi:hypothetical protein
MSLGPPVVAAVLAALILDGAASDSHTVRQGRVAQTVSHGDVEPALPRSQEGEGAVTKCPRDRSLSRYRTLIVNLSGSKV